MWEWIAILGAVAGIVGATFAIFVGLRSKQISRPVLIFNIGLLYTEQEVRKIIKKATVSTLIYGANIPQNSEIAFICPYLMMNNSKLPIFNITLQLQYASKYAIKNEEKIIGIIDRDIGYEVHVLSSPPEWYKCREVQILESMAQVRYTIPVLRPGEKIIIPDVIRFTKPTHCDELDDGDYGVNKELAKKLRGISKLQDFCVIDVFIFSDSCPPVSKRIKVLWFDANSDEELVSLSNDVIKAFWGGKWPKSGLYLGPSPWKKIMVEEYGEAIFPKLERIKSVEDRYIYWENPLQSERSMTTFVGMPAWNYYQFSGNMDPNDLILRLGFRRVISKEYIENLRNIFKGLRK